MDGVSSHTLTSNMPMSVSHSAGELQQDLMEAEDSLGSVDLLTDPCYLYKCVRVLRTWEVVQQRSLVDRTVYHEYINQYKSFELVCVKISLKLNV